MMENFNQIKKRMLEYADKKGISVRKLCEIISVNSSNFAAANLKSSINSDALCRFLSSFPDVNIEYILFGKGEILRKEEVEISVKDGFSEKIFRELLEKNAELNRRIGRLEAELEVAKKAAVAPAAESAGCAAAG